MPSQNGSRQKGSPERLVSGTATPRPRRLAGSVCIVTPGYISSSPRVVKEADALHEAGFDVRVVFSQGGLGWAEGNDAHLLSAKPWRWHAVGWSRARRRERALFWFSRLRHNLCRRIPARLSASPRWAARGEGRVYPELVRAAAGQRSDLYVGHYPAGLAAAAQAAARWRARLAYDAEDLHTEEVPEGSAGHQKRERIRRIEARCLPRCVYVTAASPGIASELARRYDIHPPLVVHNVFPWMERAQLDGLVKDRRGRRASLYWYSQSVGLDRGIEDVIRAAGVLEVPVQIHLRGSLTPTVERYLRGLAADCGVADSLSFLPPVAAGELLSRAVEHDVGLALEQCVNLSRMLSVTNKFFFYLLAGLAVAATDVPGQRSAFSTCSASGFLYDPGDHHALAAGLSGLLRSPEKLAACKRSALEAAERRWRWEVECQPLVGRIRDLLRPT